MAAQHLPCPEDPRQRSTVTVTCTGPVSKRVKRKNEKGTEREIRGGKKSEREKRQV
jgi:hypothetical protein